MTPEQYEDIIRVVDCSVCNSEIGYVCTSLVTNKPTKSPHPERVKAYQWEMHKREKYLDAKRKRLAAYRRKEAIDQARAERRVLVNCYNQYGVEEGRQLGAWLRENHGIFRIDEKF